LLNCNPRRPSSGRRLERLDRILVVLELQVREAEVIPRPRVVGVELGGLAERDDRVVVVEPRELGAAERVERLARLGASLTALFASCCEPFSPIAMYMRASSM